MFAVPNVRKKIGQLPTVPQIPEVTVPPIKGWQKRKLAQTLMRSQGPQFTPAEQAYYGLPPNKLTPEYTAASMETAGVPYTSTMTRVAPEKVPPLMTAATAPQMAGMGLAQEQLKTEAMPTDIQQAQALAQAQVQQQEIANQQAQQELEQSRQLQAPTVTGAEQAVMYPQLSPQDQAYYDNLVGEIEHIRSNPDYYYGIGQDPAMLLQQKTSELRQFTGRAPEMEAPTSTVPPMPLTPARQEFIESRGATALRSAGFVPETVSQLMGDIASDRGHANDVSVEKINYLLSLIQNAIDVSGGNPEVLQNIKNSIRSMPEYIELKARASFSIPRTAAKIGKHFNPLGALVGLETVTRGIPNERNLITGINQLVQLVEG